jgi:ATP-dependent helicase HrpA
MLQMMTLNLGDIEDFPFIEPPDDKMIRDGKTVLHEVNALDKQGKLTEVGRQLAKFPTDPKIARMLLAAADEHCLSEVAIIASALSIQDPREKPADKMQQADAKHAVFRHPESDFLTLLNIWNTFEEQKKHLSNSKLRKYCQENFLSYLRMREWHDIHSQIMQVIKGDLKLHPNTVEAAYENIHRALLTGLLSNIGFRHDQYEYLGARGLKFFIFPGSGLHKLKPKWIMAAEQVETSKVYARTVAKIEPEWIEACAGHLVKHNYYDPHWEKKAGRCGIYQRTLLYGLTLQAGRKIPYENIDPKAARELFIQSGLVGQDYHTNAPFFVHNRKLLEEVGYIQHKGRRVDLVEDELWLYTFYDQKLPPEVVNGITLDQWRKKVERENPKILFLTKESLTRDEGPKINEWDFPDHKKIGNLSIELQYRFEPGHNDDGVTAIVPVHQLNQLTQAPFDWLVPGMLEEKCIALIKSLPKQIRKHFVPVPETVRQCLEIEPDCKGYLQEWLGNRLRKLTGEAVPLNIWDMNNIPLHLQMNFRVVDENGKSLDIGRNLQQLQDKYAIKAVKSFDQIAEDELNYTGCIQWAFDDLPHTYTFTQNGQQFSGFPAMIDEGESVGVRIFDTEAKATVKHRDGLIRLIQLHLRKDCSYLLKTMPQSTAVELTYNRLPKHPFIHKQQAFNGAQLSDFKKDMLFAVLHHVFVEDRSIRTQAAFDQTISDNKVRLLTVGNEVSKVVMEILNQYADITPKIKRINSQDKRVLDINRQLAVMIYSGFIRNTPIIQLKAIPRYLKAIDYRLEKPEVDGQKSLEIKRFTDRYWQQAEIYYAKRYLLPELDSFRWALEEFRVSLFAQQLKTACPVSAQRLEKAWMLRN